MPISTGPKGTRISPQFKVRQSRIWFLAEAFLSEVRPRMYALIASSPVTSFTSARGIGPSVGMMCKSILFSRAGQVSSPRCSFAHGTYRDR